MNHSEAEKIADSAVSRLADEDLILVRHEGRVRSIINRTLTAQLDKLSPVPEDLEAAVRKPLDHWINSNIDLPDHYKEAIYKDILSAVAPFCQKPEVPESLEAAIQNEAVTWAHSYELSHDPQGVPAYLIKHLRAFVAPLLADKKEQIKELQATQKFLKGELDTLRDERIEDLENKLQIEFPNEMSNQRTKLSKLTDKQADLALRLLAIGASNLGGHYDVGEGTEINFDMEWRSMVGGLLAETGNDDFWQLNGPDEIERLLRQGGTE